MKSSKRSEERRKTIVLHRGVWRTTSTSRPFVRVVRPGGHPTITLIRLRRIPMCPRWATSPIGRLSLHGPKPAARLAMGLQPFCPWSARDRPGGPHRIPPQEGYAAPVVDAPAGPFYDGSHADVRGAVPKGYEHGANHWWLFSHLIHFRRWSTTTRLLPGRSTASKHVQKQTSRTPNKPMGTRMAVHAPTTEELHFGRPSTVERGGANPCTPSNVSRAS